MLKEVNRTHLIVLTVAILLLIFSWFCFTYAIPTHSIKDDTPREGHISIKRIQKGKRTILRKRMNWVDADLECFEQLGTHLAVVENPQQLTELVKTIFDMSAWNGSKKDYHMVNSKYEWGLERRYWIGLSDNWGNESDYYWKLPASYKNISLEWVVEEPDPPPPKPKKGEVTVPPPRNALNMSWADTQPDHNLLMKRRFHKEKFEYEHCVGLWNPNYYRGDLHSLNDMPCEDKLYAICETTPYQGR